MARHASGLASLSLEDPALLLAQDDENAAQRESEQEGQTDAGPVRCLLPAVTRPVDAVRREQGRGRADGADVALQAARAHGLAVERRRHVAGTGERPDVRSRLPREPVRQSFGIHWVLCLSTVQAVSVGLVVARLRAFVLFSCACRLQADDPGGRHFSEIFVFMVDFLPSPAQCVPKRIGVLVNFSALPYGDGSDLVHAKPKQKDG